MEWFCGANLSTTAHYTRVSIHLIVAAVFASGAAAAFFQGRSAAQDELLPTRTTRQISQDIRTAKEQLT
jgi:hypothetical protein